MLRVLLHNVDCLHGSPSLLIFLLLFVSCKRHLKKESATYLAEHTFGRKRCAPPRCSLNSDHYINRDEGNAIVFTMVSSRPLCDRITHL